MLRALSKNAIVTSLPVSKGTPFFWLKQGKMIFRSKVIKKKQQRVYMLYTPLTPFYLVIFFIYMTITPFPCSFLVKTHPCFFILLLS